MRFTKDHRNILSYCFMMTFSLSKTISVHLRTCMMMDYAGTKAGTECSSVKVMAGNAIIARASNLPEKKPRVGKKRKEINSSRRFRQDSKADNAALREYPHVPFADKDIVKGPGEK